MSTKKIKKSPINELIESSFNIIQYANAFNEYIGWSMYTGYATKDLPKTPTQEGHSYIGEWTGINKNSSSEEIKKDIDARIKILMAVHQQALKRYNNQNPILEREAPSRKEALESLSNKYFIVPEFFFRCKEGPYPLVNIDGYNPVEYIKREIKKQFKEQIEKHFSIYTTFHTYHLVIGSIMTSNVRDYEIFFDEKVEQKAKQFKEAYLKKDLAASTKTYFDNPNLRRFSPKMIRDDYKNFFDEILADVRKKPLCTVRNRGLVFFGNPATDSYAEYKYEKQKQSSIDLPLGTFKDGTFAHGNMITEWMATHPSYSITGGDKLGHPDQSFARFSPFGNTIDFDGLIKHLFIDKYKLKKPVYEFIKQIFIARNRNFDTGIELSLDHSEKRLRRTVGMNIEAGADDDNYPLTIQIVPSAGAHLDPYGLAIEQGGAAFNVDGLTSLLDEESKIKYLETLNDKEEGSIYDSNNTEKYSSDFFIENGVSYRKIYDDVYSRYMNSEWQADNGKYYYSHTQLAFAMPNSYMAGYINALGKNNETARTYLLKKGKPYNYLLDHLSSKTIDLNKVKYDKDLFVAGIGELHHYHPISPNYPLKFVVGQFDNFKNTAIKTTPNEANGGIVELRIFFQNTFDNMSLKDLDLEYLDKDQLEHSKLQEERKPVHKIYHGNGYSTLKNDRGGYEFKGLMVKYRNGYTQYIGCDDQPENKDYLKHVSAPQHYPEYISIKLNKERYIDAIYTSYSTERNEKDFNAPIKYIEFRIVDKVARKKKWTNIFQNIRKLQNITGEFLISRVIEGNKKPLDRIVGYETFSDDYNATSGELMRLEFYFGKKRYSSLPVVRSLVDTTTPPSFIPTPKKEITSLKLYYSSFDDNYCGIQVNYGKSEAPIFGLETQNYEALVLSKEERLVGIAATTVFNEYTPGKCHFVEFRFRISNKKTRLKRWSEVFNSIDAQNRMLNGNRQKKSEELMSTSKESIKVYKAKAIKRLKENNYAKEKYSFRYAYFRNLPIWKIIPHIRKADGKNERYNIEILDGLTVKIGDPF